MFDKTCRMAWAEEKQFKRGTLVAPGVVNRTKPNQKSIELSQSDCGLIGSEIEHNRTGTFRGVSRVRLPNSIERDRRD